MKTTRKNVYDMTQDRLEKIFSGFEMSMSLSPAGKIAEYY